MNTHFSLKMAGYGLVLGAATLCMSCTLVTPTHSLKSDSSKTWYKGNTHTHTLWSDGDAAPELSVAWYKEHGYDFLSLTDHNILSQDVKDVLISDEPKSKLTTERLEQLKQQFGADTIQIIEKDGASCMRLKTLPELKKRFEEPGKFLLIQGEEITGTTHVNGINLQNIVQPSPSKDNVESLREQVTAVQAHRDETGKPMFAFLNHPNWSRGVTSEQILAVPEVQFFEVFNGSPDCNNWGNVEEARPTMERKWDIVLAHRIAQNPNYMLYGVGTDDTHNYFGTGIAIPGIGWCVVLADELTPDSIAQAFLDGDFYTSSGVELDSISWNKKRFMVTPKQEAGITYTTQFIGTRKGFNTNSTMRKDPNGNDMPNRTRVYDDSIGEVLYETTDVPAIYPFQGDELYVRAKVTSTKLKERPHQESDMEMAWTQPVVIK